MLNYEKGLQSKNMTLSHAILAIAIAAIIGIGLGYGFRGLINRIGKYFRKDIEAVLSDRAIVAVEKKPGLFI